MLYVGIGIVIVAIAFVFGSASQTDYDRGYAEGRAGDPIGYSLWVSSGGKFNDSASLSDDYRKGFLAGVEARKVAGGN